MNFRSEREIDVIDLLIEWIGHWKTLIVFFVIGMLAAGCYVYIGNEKETKIDNNQSGGISSLVGMGTLSALNQEQLAEVSVQDMEEYFLSERDIKTVDEVLDLYEEFLNNFEEYNNQKADMELVERAEAFNYLANTKNIIEARKSTLTADQQIYYYARMGIGSSGGITEKKEFSDDEVANVVKSTSIKRAVLIVALAIILHFFAVCGLYIFDKKIKRTDNLSSIVNIPEYVHMIDWERIKSKKGLDRMVCNMRYAHVRRTQYTEVLGINAVATVEKLKKRQYSSVAVIGPGLDLERNDFISNILKKDSKITVKSIDSVIHSINGADDITGINAAILAVKVGVTRYVDFLEELESLRDRDVDIIGIAVFE